MSKLKAAIESGRFVVTSELTPPKGTELGPLLDRADALRQVVTAFNLTDSHAARMAMAQMAARVGGWSGAPLAPRSAPVPSRAPFPSRVPFRSGARNGRDELEADDRTSTRLRARRLVDGVPPGARDTPGPCSA